MDLKPGNTGCLISADAVSVAGDLSLPTLLCPSPAPAPIEVVEAETRSAGLDRRRDFDLFARPPFSLRLAVSSRFLTPSTQPRPVGDAAPGLSAQVAVSP
ncbi:hypothetical protein V6N12_058676 [Hibiscus sabdariffa]|uniref:Uncharacterized protein n=1 Tax=Hibiscus sabdariffa TaxID=183260 RepID=A0ABR2ETA7_9ROSI